MRGERAAPIIVTLQLDGAASGFFERQRQAHFPPKLNFIPAHLTLFHNLPGEDEEAILRGVAQHVRRAPFGVAVTGLMMLGRGVAYRVEGEALMALRASLAATFKDKLVKQDRGGFRPHVTVQNKVSPACARETMARLSEAFQPFDAVGEGVQLWCYRGGPWEGLAAVPFSAGG